MTDENREAFEKWFMHVYAAECVGTQGLWRGSAHCLDAQKAWQAARDKYAPKLTEKEAVERVAKALAEHDCEAQIELRKIFGEPHQDKSVCVSESWSAYVGEAQAALRAAGVRFKEEA